MLLTSYRSVGRVILRGPKYGGRINKRSFSIHSPALQKLKNLQIHACDTLNASTYPEIVGSPHSKLHNLIWRQPLQNIYVVKKPWNVDVRNAMTDFVRHIQDEYPAVNVIVSRDVAEELSLEESEKSSSQPDLKTILYTGDIEEIIPKTDLIVSLGGDGTILRAASAFSNAHMPPVLSFAMGTLGFLLPFDFSSFKDTFKMVYESRSKALNRNRLECHVVRKGKPSDYKSKEKVEAIRKYKKDHYQGDSESMIYATNEISLHRGSEPNLTSLDIYIDNEFLTTSNGDGLIFSTPTGSTAYSLSSGGPIVHPLIPCILLTPICPRSLSFRPLVLPSTSHIMIQMSESNRNGSIKLSIDGIPQHGLRAGDKIYIVSENGTIFIPGKHQAPQSLASRTEFDSYIEPGSKRAISQSPDSSNPKTGIWCIARSQNDWTKDINDLLGFNSSFKAINKKS